MTIFGMDVEYAVRLVMMLIAGTIVFFAGLAEGRRKGFGEGFGDGVGVSSHDKRSTIKAMKAHGYNVVEICERMDITTREYDQILKSGHERIIGY